ncbi:MAG: class I SAM-dependent methyltransferase, partial [Kiritimatiellales bacterium]|nr:class I SAM-dependent methyltransferase [Kiritimatiellales bacterium]
MKRLLCLILIMLCAVTGMTAELVNLVKESGVKGGLIVHLGCGDGKLTGALRINDRYLVHGLESDPRKVAAARRNIRSLNLYGPVSVEAWDGESLPYADNLVNMIVVEDLGSTAMKEVLRVLAPHGVACIKTTHGWTKTTKPWSEQIDEWTHFRHGADNNPVACDTLAGPPARLQWCSEPWWLRSH